MFILKYAFFGALVLGLLAVGGLFYLGKSSQGGSAPGLVDGQLSPCPSSPNCVSSEVATEAGKSVDPLPLAAWEKLPQVVSDMGGTVTSREDTYIAAEFTSSTFGFVDDVEFRKFEEGVHIRSASRVGHSDAGINRARVAEIRKRMAE